MARKISYQQAINEALAQEMRRDPSVFIMGEDVAGGAGAPGENDAWGGVLGVTKGLYHQFPGRVQASQLDQIDSEVDLLIENAVRKAKSDPKPSAADLLSDVYVSYP